MSRFATTKLSSKGQVVIPEEIRKAMRFHTGDQFIIIAEAGVVILKIISPPSINDFGYLIANAKRQAKLAKLTKQELKDAIKEARKK